MEGHLSISIRVSICSSLDFFYFFTYFYKGKQSLYIPNHKKYVNLMLCRYVSSDCDSLDVMLTSHHWEKTPEEIAADALNAGNKICTRT